MERDMSYRIAHKGESFEDPPHQPDPLHPPDLPWGLALLLGVLTGGLFFVVWDLFEASWMHRVERGSVALGFYMAAAVLFVAGLPASWHSVAHTLLGSPTVAMPYASSIAVSAFAVRLIARFVLRFEICRHYRFHRGLERQGTEAEGWPGVRVSWLWTLLFGGLYFQYKFNQINERKRALRAWTAVG
jgi:hypothetical protein